MKSQDIYQYTLISCACLVLLGVGFFTYRELFPEYKTYQAAYSDLEHFRSSYSNEKPAPFHKGVKQILITHDGEQKESVDRCISCHIAMDLPHFSPTRVVYDVNHNLVLDEKGNPLLEANPDYVFEHITQKIQELSHPAVLDELQAQGRTKEIAKRRATAEKLTELQKVEKVMQMHPLIGLESRPFENHPLETYGCTSCHGGNGRALVAKRAHGPVFDGEYEPTNHCEKPQFIECDLENDPIFARMFNDKPGHDLIFQTNPILAGPLVEARCIQCHQPAGGSVRSALDKFSFFTNQKQKQLETLSKRIEADIAAFQALTSLREMIATKERAGTIEWLNEKLKDKSLSTTELKAFESQLAYVQAHEEIASKIQQDLEQLSKLAAVTQSSFHEGQEALNRFHESQKPVNYAVQDAELMQKLHTNVDRLTTHYQRGKELFISQGCYGCHRIAGFTRNNVGPELTLVGLNYPWYIKESIVWPQADLPTSIMPNFKLDHEELADIMTFLMAQRGDIKSVSEVDYQIQLSEWEKGAKMPWERPVALSKIHDVRAGQIVFATEGCASCHKLGGFDSNIEIDSKWFQNLIPEHISGPSLAKIVAENGTAIDQHLMIKEGKQQVLEEIEEKCPSLLMTFYPQFKYASRALKDDKERLNKVLLAYIQTYGLGRDIAPKLNWSGVWRDDEWLLGHFHNPSAYSAKSLMPVMPFDDTKFYVLQNMLHAMGQKNQQKLAEKWLTEGFDPPAAYQVMCSSCHGEHRQGNGAVSQWIFPIPKNLRNPVFLQHLTKERAIHSIKHGISGTPMPPWGEAIKGQTPVLTDSQIAQLVEWLFQDVSTEKCEKWTYSPTDVIQELQQKADVDTYFEGNYIREKHYTPERLNEAKAFFEMNCAVCHGKEGAGTGVRASTMVEAKPRVLTGIAWNRSEDDMSLLRAIKYGVPGTAMVAWGDQTTAEQRLGLVMFIRTLSKTALYRDELQKTLFAAFEPQKLILQKAESQTYHHLETLEQKIHVLQKELANATSAEQAGKLYATLFDLQNELTQQQQISTLYQQLLSAQNSEKKILSDIGEQICLECPFHAQPFFALIPKLPLIYHFENDTLTVQTQEHTPIELPSNIAPQLADAAIFRETQKQICKKFLNKAA